MSFAGALMVVFVLLVRPQEFVPALQTFSLLNAVTAVAALGIAIELVSGEARAPYTPQLPWLAAFIAWCFLVTVRRLGAAGFAVAWDGVGLSAIFMAVVVASAGTFARWRRLALALVVIGAAIAATCVDQARRPAECIVIDTSGEAGDRSGEGVPDGRACDDETECEQRGKPGAAYACEKVGLFDTFTEGRRVRWRGTLGDPNELALLLGALMPLVFALAGTSRRRASSRVAATAVLGLSLWCVALTGSRGGQLVVITVLGAYFVKRYGTKGLLVGAILALPILLYGGRSGEEADSSSLERIGLLYDGMDMIRAYPLLGVGVNQFMDHAYGGMTAHNSYVLAAAELGIPGALLWTMLVYVSVKIPWVLASRPPAAIDAAVRPLAIALVVSFVGILVGIFFLSFCYKAVLFVYFGLSGALFVAARRACPQLEVTVSLRETALVALGNAAVLALVLVYSHLKGGS